MTVFGGFFTFDNVVEISIWEDAPLGGTNNNEAFGCYIHPFCRPGVCWIGKMRLVRSGGGGWRVGGEE